jgi:hypothetical protein
LPCYCFYVLCLKVFAETLWAANNRKSIKKKGHNAAQQSDLDPLIVNAINLVFYRLYYDRLIPMVSMMINLINLAMTTRKDKDRYRLKDF